MAYTKIGPDCAAVVGIEALDGARDEFVSQNQRVALIIEGGAEAIKFRDMKDDGVVVHRLIGSHGDANWEHIDSWGGPQAYIDACMETCNNNKVVMQYLNESGVFHAEDKEGETPKNVQCALDGLEYAHQRNQPITINMSGLGGPGGAELDAMVPLLRRMNEINAERGHDPDDPEDSFAWLMLHEYYPQHDPRFIGDRYDRNTGTMRWMNLNPLSTLREDGTYEPKDDIYAYGNWYCGRGARMMQELEDRHDLKCPPIIIGEFGADDLDSRYHGPFPPDFPSLTEEQYAEHLTWLSDNVYDVRDPSSVYYNYSQNVVGMTIFMFGNSGGWEGFDYHLKMIFRGLLNTYAMNRQAPDEGGVEPVMEWYIAETDVKIREAPSTSAAIVGLIEEEELVQLDTATKVVANGYEWMQHVQGWSAIGFLGGDQWLVPYEPPEPPDPDPDPDPEPPEPGPGWETILEAARLAQAASYQASIAYNDAAVAFSAAVEAANAAAKAAQYAGDAWGALISVLIEEQQPDDEVS